MRIDSALRRWRRPQSDATQAIAVDDRDRGDFGDRHGTSSPIGLLSPIRVVILTEEERRSKRELGTGRDDGWWTRALAMTAEEVTAFITGSSQVNVGAWRAGSSSMADARHTRA